MKPVFTDREQQIFAALNELLDALNSLFAQSEGVAGLHLNNEIALWADLLEGGPFEEWLISVDRARRVLDSSQPCLTKTLRFEGHSDDIFGEYEATGTEYCNCASGEPIEYLVNDPTHGLGVVVTGQFCPGSHTVGWSIAVANFQPEKPLPSWPMRFDPDGDWNALVIEAPEGVVVSCLNDREGQP